MSRLNERDEWQLRVDLAAALRLAAKLGMHESVANHFSAVVSDDGRSFLMNPKWRHFSRARASELLLLNVDEEITPEQHATLDPTAWSIHGQIHARLPHARVVMHLHPIHATAVACLEDPDIPPIDQNSARYYNRLAFDDAYAGMADEAEEGARLAAKLGNKSRLMMGNHGVLVVADTVAEAFDDMYTIERACQILTTARAQGQPIRILSPDVAEKTAQDWERYNDFALAHFDEMKRVLDAEDPSYAS